MNDDGADIESLESKGLMPLWRRALDTARREGVAVIARRVVREFRIPTTGPGRALLPIWRIPRRLRSKASEPAYRLAGPNSLVAFWDFLAAPITFDFCWFMVAAELERRRRGLTSLHFVLVQGASWESGPESSEYLSIVDAEQRKQRVFDMIFPLSNLMPESHGVTLVADRKQASRLVDDCGENVFPENYTPEFPANPIPYAKRVNDAARRGEHIPRLRAPVSACRRIAEWKQTIGEGDLITITLRQMDYSPNRNSNLEAWSDVARQLEGRGFKVVIVPDFGQALNPYSDALAGLRVMPEAALNIALRAALYEAAYVNLGVSTGPMALCWLNSVCRHITFKFSNEDEPGTSLAYHKSIGLEPDDPHPFAGPFQLICSDTDDAESIMKRFEQLRERIELSEGRRQ